jgi:hypothetical protein
MVAQPIKQKNIINWMILGDKLQGLRPKIPRHTHPKLVELLQWCWHQDPSLRPNFSEILEFLLHIFKMVCKGES